MHTSLAVVADRHQAVIEQVRQARYARALRRLHMAERAERRAQDRLLRAWRRTDELRGALDAFPPGQVRTNCYNWSS